jgi:hypothetical protein
MPDLPDPASVGAPGEDLIGRMANAIFRAATQSVAWPGGLPSGTGTPQGGFGAALPSTPLPDAFAPTVTAPSAIPAGTIPVELTKSPFGGGIPPATALPLSGTPSFDTLPNGTPAHRWAASARRCRRLRFPIPRHRAARFRVKLPRSLR